MDSKQLFWLRTWQTAAVAIVVLFASFAGCTAHTDYRIAQAIQNGASPTAAKCAFSLNAGTAECLIAEAGKR